jgi:hypothetical protein
MPAYIFLKKFLNCPPKATKMEPEYNDDQQFENELEKLKMQGEFGAKFFVGGADIPPEIEAEWLKNVRAFEETSLNISPKKTLGEIIGNPVLTPVSEINPGHIEAALEKLLEILGNKSFAVDFDEDIPTTEKYRFITEDLINKEMDVFGSFGMSVPGVPGMVTHIIYEEYYPNHYKDIIRSVENFCKMLFDRSDEYLSMELDFELVFSSGQTMHKKEFIEKAKRWFASYRSFTINKLGFMKPEFTIEHGMGHVNAYLDYDAMQEDGAIVNFEGPSIFYMHFLGGYWFICGMDFPGFKEWALT